jgi:hypothetical protein
VAVVDATFVSSTEVTCITPPMPEMEVAVHVATNGIDFGTVGTARFSFRSTLTVAAILPVSGVQEGGTTVTAFGSNFRNSPDLACRFGFGKKKVVAARWVSSEEITCISPPHLGVPGPVPFAVTNNGQQFTLDSRDDYDDDGGNDDDGGDDGGVVYEYHGPPVIWSVTPDHGPPVGGTVVTVNGQHLRFGESLSCRFGVAQVRAAFTESGSQVECRSPPHTMMNGVGAGEVGL